MKLKKDTITNQNLANYSTSWSVQEYVREEGLRHIELSLIEKFFPKSPAMVLDLGCGAGRTTIGLAKKGYQVAAIDLSASLLEKARQRFPSLDFRLMDATKLDFSDGSFDAALFSFNGIDCVYPAAKRVQCMTEVFRILRPGGVFIFSSHNLIGTIFSGGYYHLKRYWNAAKLLAAQLGNPLVREWYIKYSDGGGVQYLYSALPSRTVCQLEKVGFKVVDICGNNLERNKNAIYMRQMHVHFTAKKPI